MNTPGGREPPMDDDSESQLRKYTLEEANALLPEVRPVLTELRGIWLDASPERRAFERVQASAAGPVEVSLAHQRLVGALWEVQPLVAWVRSRDIVLRDPATGLVDFFSEIDGQDCFLCWRLDEDEIRYWHGTDEGFVNRKPLGGA